MIKSNITYAFFILAGLLVPYTIFGQNYYLDKEVNDTIIHYNYRSTDACFPDPDVSLGINKDLVSLPTGLHIKVIINEIIPDSGMVGSVDGLLSKGDELFFSDSILEHPIYFYTAEEIKFSYVVAGTPTVLGEEYYCGIDTSFSLANCNNWFKIYPDSIFPKCQVMRSSTTVEFFWQDLLIYPNPILDVLHIKSTVKIDVVKVYDMTGNLILTKRMQVEGLPIDISAIPTGIYMMQINAGKFSTTQRVVKI